MKPEDYKYVSPMVQKRKSEMRFPYQISSGWFMALLVSAGWLWYYVRQYTKAIAESEANATKQRNLHMVRESRESKKTPIFVGKARGDGAISLPAYQATKPKEYEF